MKYGHLPGGPPQRQRGSPARIVAGHIVSQFLRPGRVRSRLLLLSLALFGSLFILYGRRHSTELHFTAATLTTYIPTGITSTVATQNEPGTESEPEYEIQDTRWDDTKNGSDSNHIVFKKPTFHLVIPAYKPSAPLCRALLSAAILDFPPPTLIGYGGKPNKERLSLDGVKSTFGFLTGKDVRADDLVLIVSEDTIFQLPAPITLSRFFSNLHSASTTLLKQYGRLPNTDDSTSNKPQNQPPQRYTPKLLFSASKSCFHASDSQACLSVPDSPLPHPLSTPNAKPQTSEGINTSATTHPPHFLGSGLHIGRASSLIPLYKRATELLEISDLVKNGVNTQHVFQQLFGEQEYARSLVLEEEKKQRPTWKNWLSSIFSKQSSEGELKPEITPNDEGKEGQNADGEKEFGITLDYSSSVFQDPEDSIQDLQFVVFDDQKGGSKNGAPSRIEGKAKTWKIKRPIRLPNDLSKSPGPFEDMDLSSIKSTPYSKEGTHTDSTSWSEIPLLTNTLIPASSIPAILSLNLPNTKDPVTQNDLWTSLWFHNSSRRLLTQHVQLLTANPNPEPLFITASSSSDSKGKGTGKGGSGDTASDITHYLDIRPGKSPLGAWTDKGEWVGWKDLCGGFGGEVFSDGAGEFGVDVGDDDYRGKEEEAGKGGKGGWVGHGEGEGFVKGLWGMVVGDYNEEKGAEKEKDESSGKEKSEGQEVGGLEQGVVVVNGVEKFKDTSGDGDGSERHDKNEGKQGTEDGNSKEEQGKLESQDGAKKEDQKEEPKTDNSTKEGKNGSDAQKAEVEDNTSMKDKNKQAEEGAVRYQDEKEQQKDVKDSDEKNRDEKKE
ncbi:hypothetical protein ONS95_005674 [Cadophora gregata]|uniref:uncharacterized protein n=1 Tax=Cadophora gregata TaxID=51156 RepID=UPI0026DB293C|nr:uncharacterized protein ONS95_005674 [Cadophora gregata]KAK0103663.1 hypothetical protein ONS95_005674 [Cadophora gregata]KAK0107856.1 hypothetical protein ONS96_003646 [Cadophora gregata f. sp. sojae]